MALPSSSTAGRLLPVKVTKAPTLSVEGPRSVPSRISVVLVDGTMAGDTPGQECPREDGFWRLRVVAPVYQTVSFATKDEWNTSDNDSLTMIADEVDEWNTSDSDSLTMTADENYPDMNDFYQRVVSSDDENYWDSNNGSVTDCDGSISEGAYCVGSDDGSVADLDVDILDIVDYDDSDIRSVMDVNSGSSGVDMEDDYDFNRMSVGNSDLYLYDRRLCLLCPGGTADLRILRNGSVDGLNMDHTRTATWDPGITDSRTLSVCYDCLCLMALFRTVMCLIHYWTGRIVWTGHDEGSGGNIAWMEQYLPGLYPPCVVDRLPNDVTKRLIGSL